MKRLKKMNFLRNKRLKSKLRVKIFLLLNNFSVMIFNKINTIKLHRKILNLKIFNRILSKNILKRVLRK